MDGRLRFDRRPRHRLTCSRAVRALGAWKPRSKRTDVLTGNRVTPVGHDPGMEPVLIAVVVIVATGAGVVVGSLVARQRAHSTGEVDQVARLEQAVRDDLDRLTQAVGRLGERHAQQFGQVDASLRAHAEVTRHLYGTTRRLQDVLANPKARGQWGERMVDDVLRLAGFVEHVNYVKQTAVAGEARAIPDVTFFMPKDQVLHLDVKFPLASYVRALDADGAERDAHLAQFVRDVRQRVRELARREYPVVDGRPALDQVLLFLPNESVLGTLFDLDPALVDDAMRQGVVLCSPVSLFALLAVIRQAVDSYQVERTSDRIVEVLGRFDDQWRRYTASLDAVQKRFDAVHREFETLNGTRRRGLERPLEEVAELRRARGLAVAEVHELGA